MCLFLCVVVDDDDDDDDDDDEEEDDDDDDDDDDDEFEFEFYCPLLFYQLGQEKKSKQPKRKQNAENKRETKMRPNMIK